MLRKQGFILVYCSRARGSTGSRRHDMMPGAKNWWIIFPFIHRREGRRGRKRGERRERKVMARL